MGSISGYRIDYNGVGVRRGQRHIPRKIDPSTPHPPRGVRADSTVATISVAGILVGVTTLSVVKKPQCCLRTLMAGIACELA